jgi:hypothetical protein
MTDNTHKKLGEVLQLTQETIEISHARFEGKEAFALSQEEDVVLIELDRINALIEKLQELKRPYRPDSLGVTVIEKGLRR